ncbi:MAG: DNA mismatch repair endonuclease MutL [Ignavibacteriales bacterium]|nr:DNA mismatch repair endonuclease MutL [Ignavibacteriales bacterium]
MNRAIKILPEHLANKIAAGEVIQRPASAVKELIENSLDANANSIQIIIQNGGVDLIKVVDNGIGMSSEDAKVAFHRHATSKIETYEDLESIRTLGFRGEALASIAAVSQVEMRTRDKKSELGTKVRINGDDKIEITQDASPIGTTISMRNLFFNTPARRHFLKSISTEYRHVYEVIQRCAISKPDVEFQFYSDEELILHYYSSNIENRIKDIFGKSLTSTLLPLEGVDEPVSITGFIGQPQFARRGKVEQFIFLNNRFIVSKNLNHAVYQGYEHLIEKGAFPFFILFLTIDPKKVDVNVHPSKMEVKFDDESSIYKMFLTVVRSTLKKYNLIPQIKLESRGNENPVETFRLSSQPVSMRNYSKETEELTPGKPSEKAIQHFQHLYIQRDDNVDRTGQTVHSITDTKYQQLRNKYIIVRAEDGLLIIDQHAAHERIIFEKVKSRFINNEKNSQQLLFPVTVQLTPADSLLVKEMFSDFELLGFSLKYFGNNTVIIDGVPPEIKPGMEGTIFEDVLSLYKDDKQDVPMKPSERLAKSFACKAAIKAGDPLNQTEMKSLIDQLSYAEIPNVCPHGRPVSMKLTIEELDKRFGRTS